MALYTIPAGIGFAEALVRGLLPEADRDPLAFARLRLLLPSRRACRTIRDAFLREAQGRALVLPTFSALGDIDDDDLTFSDSIAVGSLAASLPPAIPAVRRQAMLAQLIRARDPGLPLDRAAALAAELARLMNQAQAEGLGFDGLTNLVPESLAHHWQITLDFLRIVTETWPLVLAEEQALDPIDRRDTLIRLQAQVWAETPPPGRVIVAGTTGSQKSARDLIAVIARLPQGDVILPGLDTDMPEAEWGLLPEHPTHPQAGLQDLLSALDLPRTAVAIWPGCIGAAQTVPDRARLLAQALSVAAPEDHAAEPLDLDAAIADVRRIDAGSPQEEAMMIAVALRQALETPERTAALITPDRDLARRVAAELARYGVRCDDSAGQPLSGSVPGVFLRLLAEAARDAFAPAPLLALLKHPLTGLGLSLPEARRAAQLLEERVLRGPRPEGGLAGLRTATEAALAELSPERSARDALILRPYLDRLDACLRPWEAAMATVAENFRTAILAHLTAAEALCATDTLPGEERLWAGPAGEAAADFLSDLVENAGALVLDDPSDYPALLMSFMGPVAVRQVYDRHPRLAILGPLEARLARPDLMILAGLNEGTWPAEPPGDPWMSRPMRQQFGLPALERRIGLSAHDFVQAAMAPTVIFSRADRVEGTPTVPSRWLQRLDVLLAGQGRKLAGSALPLWAAALDRPARYAPHPAPEPCPPVHLRPRSLYVTDIELWRRDPYGLYAKRILGLKALDSLDADPGAAERGQVIHEALDLFVKAYPDGLPVDALPKLLQIGRTAFGKLLVSPSLHAFWWPRFERVADWFVAEERRRRGGIAAIRTEVTGALTVEGPAGPFTIKAKADRIERTAEGGYRIIDYKTGTPPTETIIQAGYAPQLPLEALIAEVGGFADLPALPVEALEFWHLSGGSTPGKIQAVKQAMANLLLETRGGIASLIAHYDDADTPYPVTPRAQFAPRFSDYTHLARVAEWSGGGEGEE